MTTPDALTKRQKLAIGLALLVGALLTLAMGLSMSHNGPGSAEMWKVHQSDQPEQWQPATSLAMMATHWKDYLNAHQLELFPVEGATLVGGSVVDETWRHLRWTNPKGRLSMFLRPLPSQKQSTPWACKPVGHAKGTMCQQASRGWHVVLISNAETR